MNLIKRATLLTLALVMALGLTACGGGAVSHDACHNDNKDQQ